MIMTRWKFDVLHPCMRCANKCVCVWLLFNRVGCRLPRNRCCRKVFPGSLRMKGWAKTSIIQIPMNSEADHYTVIKRKHTNFFFILKGNEANFSVRNKPAGRKRWENFQLSAAVRVCLLSTAQPQAELCNRVKRCSRTKKFTGKPVDRYQFSIRLIPISEQTWAVWNFWFE